jgi:hypothetical protein
VNQSNKTPSLNQIPSHIPGSQKAKIEHKITLYGNESTEKMNQVSVLILSSQTDN